MMKILILCISFVAVTISVNSQGKFGPIKTGIQEAIKIIDKVSDVYQIMSPMIKTESIENYSVRNPPPKVRNSNIKLPNSTSIAYPNAIKDNSKELALDYRKWANSTPEISSKYGANSIYHLDEYYEDLNNSHFQKSYAVGKDEFHKIHPISKYRKMGNPKSFTFLRQEAQKHSGAALKLLEKKKYNYLPTDKKNTFLDDELLLSNSINNSVEQNMTLKYEEESIGNNEKGIYESYLDQKLKENINKELINFKREINSIVIKSKNIDLKNEYINKPY